MKLPYSKKAIIEKVISDKLSKVEAAQALSVSRKTVYKFIERYKSQGENSLFIKVNRKKNFKSTVLKIASVNPGLGPFKIARELKKRKISLSTRTIWKILKEMNLETRTKREEHSYYFRTPKQSKDKTLPGHLRLSPEARKRMIERVINLNEKVSDVAREMGTTRKTFAKWKKRYLEAQKKGQNILLCLGDQHPLASRHPRGASQKVVEAVINIIVENPELSSHKIAEKLQTIGNHGVQRVLARLNLNKYEFRLAYAQAQKAQVKPVFASFFDRIKLVWERFIPSLAPAPPPEVPTIQKFPSKFRFLPLAKPFFASSFLMSTFSLGILFWARLLGAQTPSSAIGLVFATVGLLMGTFFFLYSIKYYLTIAIVLSFSQQEREGGVGDLLKKKGLLAWILGIQGRGQLQGAGVSRPGPVGLEPNLEHVSLGNYPMISVHIPLYNEKNVVERAIKAATSFEYPGEYEVIICDDSTDETTDIIRKYQEKFLLRNEKLHKQKGDGWILTKIELKPGVTLKHLHRTSRAGFKGGALRLALSVCDHRAEFISVFDADFVPYPDSLTLFLKYFKVQNNMSEDYRKFNVAAVQGYQWHVLNKSENWITKGVRTEYAGSYVIERSGEEIYGGLKQISGSVYMIRRDVLEEVGWETSITEDFELTLKLYEKGYKVVYTPYIQAPAECVSTIKRLVRQRMRWAEGHSFNVKKMFTSLIFSKKLTSAEKMEFLYLAPYYLQAFFFLIGTVSWFISETLFPARLPFWTSLWGWSLVLTNMLSLPLMNSVGLFLEESEGKDYSGIASFVALSYIIVPFQAYAAVKGFLEKEEGPWFRTPKTGKITDILKRGSFYRFISAILPGKFQTLSSSLRNPTVSPSFEFQMEKDGFYGRKVLSEIFSLSGIDIDYSPAGIINVIKKGRKFIGNTAVVSVILISLLINTAARFTPSVSATDSTVKTIDQAKNQHESEDDGEEDGRMDLASPVIYTFPAKDGQQIEEVFHLEPKIRIKTATKEIEIATIGSEGLGSVSHNQPYKENGQIVYPEIFKGVDVRYTPTETGVTEDYILSEYKDVSEISSVVRMVGVTAKEENGVIVFYDEETQKKVFTFAPGYMYEDQSTVYSLQSKVTEQKSKHINLEELAESGVKFSLGITYKLRKTPIGWELVKSLTDEGRKWLSDPERQFPVAIDPSVVVSGGIVETDVEFGGQQRKVAYVNGNWYAFHNDGADVFYKKSSDGVSWGSNVDIDTTDADNYNTSIWVKGNVVWVGWYDDSAVAIEFNSINTASGDALGSKCTSSSLGASHPPAEVVSIAVQQTGTDIYVASSSNVATYGIFKVTSACIFTDITTNSGLGVGDYPALASIGDDALMVFQDGNLSYSVYNGTDLSWAVGNTTIADITNSTFSLVTDGTTSWILTVSGTTATNFYRIGANQTAAIDSTINLNRSMVDIACPAGDNCKIVYWDPSNTRVKFVDCNDTACSAPTITVLSNVTNGYGGGGYYWGIPSAVFCITSADCKVAIHNPNGNAMAFMDCDTEACDTINSNLFGTGAGAYGPSYIDMYCPAANDCKITYLATDIQNLRFVDCAGTACATNVNTQLDSAVSESGGTSSIWCPTAADCKVAYLDLNLPSTPQILFVDCNSTACATNAITLVANVDVGSLGQDEQVFVSMDCSVAASDCKIVYNAVIDSTITFVDCNSATSCASGFQSVQTIDSSVGSQGSPVAISCKATATDCKVVYNDPSTGDIIFVDCNATDCGSNVPYTIDSDVGGDTAYVALDCTVALTDCKVVYNDGTDHDLTFVDCGATDCSTNTLTDIDTSIEVASPLAMDCPSADDCKIVYQDVVGKNIIFVDCNDTTCSAPSLTTLVNTKERFEEPLSIFCVSATDCKVVVHYDGSLYFYDCNAADCSSSSSTAIDSTVNHSVSFNRIYCLDTTDCKVIYNDTDASAVKMIDCSDANCSAPASGTVDADAMGTIFIPTGVDLDCSLGTADCRVVFYDRTDADATYIDCSATACSTKDNTTDINTAIGFGSDPTIKIDCLSGADCQIIYEDFNNDTLYHVDCNAAACGAPVSTTLDTSVGGSNREEANLDCQSTGACKVAYYSGKDNAYSFISCSGVTPGCGVYEHVLGTTSGISGGAIAMDCISDTSDCKIIYSDSVNSTIKFVDCISVDCSVASLTAPWSSQTNVTSVSLSLDTTNSLLYAHIIKDTSEQAYFNSTDKTTISWGVEYSYGFTAGDLGHISSPMTGAGPTQIGVVLRQGSNFEFSAVPERWPFLILSGAFVVRWMKRRRLATSS